MNFEDERNPEHEAFRRAVGAWLDQHAPEAVRGPLARALAAPAVRAWARVFQARLADRGWAAPSWPQEFGGGGLTAAHDRIVQEELDRRQVPQLYGANYQVAAAVLAWGSAEQRRSWVQPLLRGDRSAWKSVAEAEAVADPDGVMTQAVRDGDVYVVAGEEVFTGVDAPSWYWTLAVTDPLAPAHARLSAFLIPADLQGITTSDYESIAPGERRAVFLDHVSVPVEYRIGPEGAGWLVAQSVIAADASADRLLHEQQTFVGRLVQHFQQRPRAIRTVAEQEALQERLADAWIDLQVLRLIAARNRWLAETRQPTTYQEAQFALIAQAARARLTSIMDEVLGPLGLVDDAVWAPLQGDAVWWQQAALPGVAGGDDAAFLRVIAHALGLSSEDAVRERVAPN